MGGGEKKRKGKGGEKGGREGEREIESERMRGRVRARERERERERQRERERETISCAYIVCIQKMYIFKLCVYCIYTCYVYIDAFRII